MGWTETKTLWRVPRWKINVYMHCHLYEEGAKVLTRKANENLAAKLDAMMQKLCLAQR